MIRISTTVLVGGLLLLLVPARAQEGENAFFRGADFSSTLKGSYWRAGGRNLAQVVIPIVYSHAFNNQFSLDVTSSPALAAASDQDMILGVASTKLRASYIYNNLVLLTAGVRVPSGTNNLSPSQAGTAGVLATRPLSFTVPSFTGGLNAILSAATAYSFGFIGPGEMAAGLAASYQFKGGFTPLAEGKDYNPGDEIGANASLEYTLTGSGKIYRFSGNAAFTFFFDDTYGDRDIFSPGLQTALSGVLSIGTAQEYSWALSFPGTAGAIPSTPTAPSGKSGAWPILISS
jgi:hypothetical protein